MAALALVAAALWLVVLLLPWRPWSTRERIEPEPPDSGGRLDFHPSEAITVLIPARNEAATIRITLESVNPQAGIDGVVVVDDQSDDDTAAIAVQVPGVEVIEGRATPAGWSGKLWAQQQGLERIETPLVLLIDADIRLAPGMVPALADKLECELDQVSVMASLPASSWPEKLMLPAFVYFFKLLYPFAWVNRDDRSFAAAAGGCVLVRRELLEQAGAFEAWKDTLID
ncbi:MAG: glycosyltransferase, partial [Wenzhouxiangellaceae bacterium]